jgi:hypothetical protein
LANRIHPLPDPAGGSLPIPDEDTCAVELAVFVGVYAPRRRTGAWLLIADEHESRGGRHARAHAQPPRPLLTLVVLLALAQLVDAEQYAEERQSPRR